MRALGALLVAAAASVAACSTAAPPPAGAPAQIARWPRGRYSAPGTKSPSPLFDSVTVETEPDTIALLSMRATLTTGAVELVVVDEHGKELARRRITRLGEDFVSVLAPTRRSTRLAIGLEHPANTGPVEIEVGALETRTVTPESASATAALVAKAFEAETERLGDPAVDNLVPNADFADDDEVRGTPADWSTYVPTEFDPQRHALRVAGAPNAFRPYVATGPVAVARGRRYRAVCRARVEAGAVVFRAVDYDELVGLGDAAPFTAGDEVSERVLEFTAPPGAHAVRLWLAPAEAAADARFELYAVQLELLPGAPG